MLSAEDKPSSSKKRAAHQALEVTLIARSPSGDYLSVDDMRRLLSRDQNLFQNRTGYVHVQGRCAIVDYKITVLISEEHSVVR